MSRAPSPWSIVGSGHENQLWIRWTKYEPIGITADFVFPSCPLLSANAGVRAHVKSSAGDGIQEFGIARMNHQAVDVLVEARKLLPVLACVRALQQSADFNRSVYRGGFVGTEVDVLDVANMRWSGKAPFRHAGYRSEGGHFAPVKTEVIAGEQMRRLGAGKQANVPVHVLRRQRVDVGFR